MADTLSHTIAEYRNGLKAYADKHDATPEETYQPAHDILAHWKEPAASAAETYEALKLLKEEGCSDISDVAQAMLEAALSYFEHKMGEAD